MKKIIKFDETPVILRITGSGIPPPQSTLFYPRNSPVIGDPLTLYRLILKVHNQTQFEAQRFLSTPALVIHFHFIYYLLSLLNPIGDNNSENRSFSRLTFNINFAMMLLNNLVANR